MKKQPRIQLRIGNDRGDQQNTPLYHTTALSAAAIDFLDRTEAL